MSVALKAGITVAEFLEWEERQPLKYEFDGFAPVAMTGGSAEHALIQVNLITALRTRLRGGACRVFGSELKAAVAGSIRYPDAMVVCSAMTRGTQVAAEPVILFEIVSPSSASTDHVRKNREYRDTPSVRRYVILEQAQMAATVFARAGEDWVGHILVGEQELDLPELGIAIPLRELYEDVDFPSETDEPRS